MKAAILPLFVAAALLPLLLLSFIIPFIEAIVWKVALSIVTAAVTGGLIGAGVKSMQRSGM